MTIDTKNSNGAAPLTDFKHGCAVVTGSANGLGRALALALADAGLKMVLADMDRDSLSEVEKEIGARGGECIAVQTDVSDLESVTALADRAYERFGAVSLLCSNAGVSPRPFRPIWENSYEDYKWVMGVNFWGVVHGAIAFLPRMRATEGRRHMVITNSLSHFREYLARHSAYVTSKRAADGFAECLAAELEPEGIDVTVVYPGRVRSRLGESERLRPESERSEARDIEAYQGPLVVDEEANPLREPDEIAPMIIEAIVNRRRYLMTHEPPREAMLARLSHLLGERVTIADADRSPAS